MVGPLAYLLKNRFYVGDVVYKGEVHKGEHGAKWIELQILPRISLSRPNTRSLPVRGIRSPKIKMAAPSLKPANDVIHVSKLLSA